MRNGIQSVHIAKLNFRNDLIAEGILTVAADRYLDRDNALFDRERTPLPADRIIPRRKAARRDRVGTACRIALRIRRPTSGVRRSKCERSAKDFVSLFIVYQTAVTDAECNARQRIPVNDRLIFRRDRERRGIDGQLTPLIAAPAARKSHVIVIVVPACGDGIIARIDAVRREDDAEVVAAIDVYRFIRILIKHCRDARVRRRLILDRDRNAAFFDRERTFLKFNVVIIRRKTFRYDAVRTSGIVALLVRRAADFICRRKCKRSAEDCRRLPVHEAAVIDGERDRIERVAVDDRLVFRRDRKLCASDLKIGDRSDLRKLIVAIQNRNRHRIASDIDGGSLRIIHGRISARVSNRVVGTRLPSLEIVRNDVAERDLRYKLPTGIAAACDVDLNIDRPRLDAEGGSRRAGSIVGIIRRELYTIISGVNRGRVDLLKVAKIALIGFPIRFIADVLVIDGGQRRISARRRVLLCRTVISQTFHGGTNVDRHFSRMNDIFSRRAVIAVTRIGQAARKGDVVIIRNLFKDGIDIVMSVRRRDVRGRSRRRGKREQDVTTVNAACRPLPCELLGRGRLPVNTVRIVVDLDRDRTLVDRETARNRRDDIVGRLVRERPGQIVCTDAVALQIVVRRNARERQTGREQRCKVLTACI